SRSGRDERAERPAEAVVDELRRAVREVDLLGVEVSVDDPGGVERLEAGRGAAGDVEDLVEREGGPPEPLRERLSGQRLEDQVVDILQRSQVVEGAEVRVQEPDRGSEAGRPPRRQRLDRERRPARVARAPDLPRIVRAQARDEAERAKSGSGK